MDTPGHLTDQTLEEIALLGDRIAEDVHVLEKWIRLVKTESLEQLVELAAKLGAMHKANEVTDEVLIELEKAAVRCDTLEKFWKQEVAMRNRAVHFGGLKGTSSLAWAALAETFERRQPRPF